MQIFPLLMMTFILFLPRTSSAAFEYPGQLGEYCQKRAVAPFYSKEYQDRAIEKMFLVSYQSLMMETLRKHWYELSQKVGPSQWEQVLSEVQNDVRYHCKSSGKTFSARQFRYDLMTSSQVAVGAKSFLQHDQLLKNLPTSVTSQLHRTNLSLARQVFRDLCSWNGVVSDAQDISSYLSDPAAGWKTLQYIFSSRRPFLCTDEGCSAVSQEQWRAQLPRPQERRSLQEDLQDYWCSHFFHLRTVQSSAMRWKMTFAGDLLANRQDPFFLAQLGISPQHQWEEGLRGALHAWSKSEVESLAQNKMWEETLRMELQDRGVHDLPPKGLSIEVVYGEFDRNFVTFDKLNIPGVLKLPKSLLQWGLRQQSRAPAEVKRAIALKVDEQLKTLSSELTFLRFTSPLQDQLTEWIVTHLPQLNGKTPWHDGGSESKNASASTSTLELPLTFHTGLMALKLLSKHSW